MSCRIAGMEPARAFWLRPCAGTPSKSKASCWNEDIPWVSPRDMKAEFIVKAQDYVASLAIGETAVTRITAMPVMKVNRSVTDQFAFEFDDFTLEPPTSIHIVLGEDRRICSVSLNGLQALIKSGN